MGAALHGPYIITFVVFSLGISVLALRLGRGLTPAQDHPYAAARSRVVAQHRPAPAEGPGRAVEAAV